MKRLFVFLACALLSLCACRMIEPEKNKEVDVVAQLVIPTQLAECLDFYAVYEDFDGNRDSTKIEFSGMTESEYISYVLSEMGLFKTDKVGATCKVGFVAAYRTDFDWVAPDYEARVIIAAGAADFYNGGLLDYLVQSYSNYDEQTIRTCHPDFILEEMDNTWKGVGKAYSFGTKWDETYGLLATSNGTVSVPDDFWPEL